MLEVSSGDIGVSFLLVSHRTLVEFAHSLFCLAVKAIIWCAIELHVMSEDHTLVGVEIAQCVFERACGIPPRVGKKNLLTIVRC